jgi:hypothetical protein
MLLKSSDFIVHDLSAESVFEGCMKNVNDSDNSDKNDDEDQEQVLYKLELVLRKWFAIDPSREMRAFVREGVLIGAFISILLDNHIYILFLSANGQVYRSVVIRTITSF